jgi:hypothetical protein
MFNDQPGGCDRLRNITFKFICYRNTSCNNIRNICKLRTRNAAVFDALVMQFSICMTKRATQPDHSLLARSMNTVSGHSSMSSFSSLEEQGRK